MSLSKFFKTIFKKVWLLALCVILFTVAGFVVAKFAINPTYASDGLVYVSSKETASDNNDLIFSKSLVKSYIIIIKSDSFIDLVRDDVAKKGVVYTTPEIFDMIKTTPNEETFNIEIHNKNAEHAHIICSSFLEFVKTEIPGIVGNIKDNAVVILNPSKLSTEPVAPDVLLFTAIFFLIGMTGGVILIMVLAQVDDRIKNEDDLAELELPVLGIIYNDLDYAAEGATENGN